MTLEPNLNESLTGLFDIAALIQKVLPEAVLVGGLGCSLYSHHRKPDTIEFGIVELKEDLHRVGQRLNFLHGWTCDLNKSAHGVSGNFKGISVKIKLIHRAHPMQLLQFKAPGGDLNIGTYLEMLQTQAQSAYEQNSVSSLVDFAELASRMPVNVVIDQLIEADNKLIWERSPATLLNIMRCLVLCDPWDKEDRRFEKTEWISPTLLSWEDIESKCQELGKRLCRKALIASSDNVLQYRNTPMIHRHINVDTWTLMAIESLFDRGEIDDWKEFAKDLQKDPSLIPSTLRVCEYRKSDGAEMIARVIVDSIRDCLK